MTAPVAGRKDWPTIVTAAHTAYPASAAGAAQWHQGLADTEVMGALLKDLLRIGDAPAEANYRPMPTVAEGLLRLQQMRGEDYTSLPFRQAFRQMAGKVSIGQVADTVGLPSTKVHGLLAGERVNASTGARVPVEPTMTEMEVIANGYGRHPTYFVEYRARLISILVHQQMVDNPEMSASLIQRAPHLQTMSVN